MADPPSSRDGQSYWARSRRAKKKTDADMQDLEILREMRKRNDVAVENQNPSSVDDSPERSVVAEEVGCSYDTQREGNTPESVADVNEAETFCSDMHQIYTSESDNDDCLTSSDSDEVSLAAKLALWANEFRISHVAINKLLHILKPSFSDLPSDARTLLQSPRSYPVKTIGNGEYFHFGVAHGLESVLSKMDLSLIHEVHLQFNIDGLPLFRSSNCQFWPILCLVTQSPLKDPFVVGLFCGNSKPNVSFLNDFVDEVKGLMDLGMKTHQHHVRVMVHSIVCDAPARAFVKCIKSHSGYSSCEKCTQKGEWYGKVVFTNMNAALRTDEQFIAKSDEDHHLQGAASPLERLSIGMVSHFPLDPMHLLYLGVMRRMLLNWTRGPLTVRISSRIVTQISGHLMHLSQFIPREFSRRSRSLSEIDRWKATEFRLFLLYLGPVVLASTLKESFYKHFLLLFAGCTLLSKSTLCNKTNISYADNLLRLFVQGISELYGKEDLVYNIHGLLHIAADAQRFGTLENFSSFPFENKLKSIKRLVRKPQLPLQQVVRRLLEQERTGALVKTSISSESKPQLLREHCRGPVPVEYVGAKQFSQVLVSNICLATNNRDSCVALADGTIAVVNNILMNEDDIVIVYKKFGVTMSLFEYPLNSDCLGIYKVSRLGDSLDCTKLSSVVQKCLLLPCDLTADSSSSYAVLPLLH